ncbi:MAG: hypothetical protein JWO38_2448 [Gemmataceae bacterium]|nr:hypothetical protein [Gemmataceae bacterium]
MSGLDYNLLRSWLDLPPGLWPPDHYAVLGFAPGGCDPAAVEPRVMECMDVLRRHQLVHPDLVTEGMNQLAQALITLTDPIGKAAYDAELGVPAATPIAVSRRPAPPRPAQSEQPPVVAGRPTPLVVAEPVFDDDVFGDDVETVGQDDREDVTQVIVVPVPGGTPPPYEVIPDDEPVTPLSLDPAVTATGRPAETEVEVVEAVPIGPTADGKGPNGPAARRWIYARLALLRRALRAWERLRPVLGDPQDPIDRPGRVLAMLEAAAGVRPLLPSLRGVVGGAGEPGGVVAAVVGQPLILDTLRRLLPDQRQAVAIDWRRAQVELQNEYSRLRGRARESRTRPAGARGGPVLLRWVMETPEIALVVLAALAVGIALLRGAPGR